MNRGTECYGIDDGISHALVPVAVPPPGSPSRWVTACGWDPAEQRFGAFDPLADDACPDCRAVLLDEPPIHARPEGLTLSI